MKRSMLAKYVEKGSELQKGNPLRKFKGRTVFQGNSVKDENAEQALFAELGSAPSTMEAAKAMMLMELCLVTAPNNPMGDRHIRRHYTRESRHGYASQSIAGRKVGPQSMAIQ